MSDAKIQERIRAKPLSSKKGVGFKNKTQKPFHSREYLQFLEDTQGQGWSCWCVCCYCPEKTKETKESNGQECPKVYLDASQEGIREVQAEEKQKIDG